MRHKWFNHTEDSGVHAYVCTYLHHSQVLQIFNLSSQAAMLCTSAATVSVSYNVGNEGFKGLAE